ncbi:MAG: hypothetical protein ACTHJT_16745 [Cytophaga sp.]|uniref:hypothetical protein n=1 Tax=Cytophaga sp. TaxID=29535 RepID=UPI003F81DC81
MLLSLFYAIAFFLQSILTPGANKIDGKHVKIIHARITRIAFMDSVICESSALAKPEKDLDLYYTLNDSGSDAEIFAINGQGTLLDTKKIPDAKNRDWEELVCYKDSLQNQHIVIGDIGNNRNQRKDLCLYNYDVNKNQTIKHTYHYEDQVQFPPAKDSMNFDCEAFFRRDSSYYFISKNRGVHSVKIYRLAQDTTAHTATVQQRLQFKGMVNACSVFQDKSSRTENLAMLLYGRIFLFHILETPTGIQLQSYGVIKFPSAGQSEGICWYNKNELRATNERGKLFKIVIKK